MKTIYITLSLLFINLSISSAQHFFSIGYGDFYEADRSSYTSYSSNKGDIDDPNALTDKITHENIFDSDANIELQLTDSIMIEVSIGNIVMLNDDNIDTVVYNLMGLTTDLGTSNVTVYSTSFGNIQSSSTDDIKYFSFKGVENQKDTIVIKLDVVDKVNYVTLWKFGKNWRSVQLTSTVISNSGRDLFASEGGVSVGNPSQNGILTIQMEQDVSQLSFELLSLDGTVVLEEKLEEVGSHPLDVSTLKAGLYILRELTTGSTKKIMVQ